MKNNFLVREVLNNMGVIVSLYIGIILSPILKSLVLNSRDGLFIENLSMVVLAFTQVGKLVMCVVTIYIFYKLFIETFKFFIKGGGERSKFIFYSTVAMVGITLILTVIDTLIWKGTGSEINFSEITLIFLKYLYFFLFISVIMSSIERSKKILVFATVLFILPISLNFQNLLGQIKFTFLLIEDLFNSAAASIGIIGGSEEIKWYVFIVYGAINIFFIILNVFVNLIRDVKD